MQSSLTGNAYYCRPAPPKSIVAASLMLCVTEGWSPQGVQQFGLKAAALNMNTTFPLAEMKDILDIKFYSCFFWKLFW